MRERVVQLTILGCRAGMPAAGQASSGYLVRSGETNILLDAGPGIAAALSRHLGAHRLSAVFISHLHTDHLYDLVPIGKSILAARTSYDHSTGLARLEDAPKIPLFVPAGGREKLDLLSSVFPVTTQPWLDKPFELAFDVVEYSADQTFRTGDVTVSLAELRHVATSCGIRLEAGGKSLVYTGDTGVTEALVSLASTAGTLLAESTLDETDPGPHGHMSSGDAGRAAAAAGVGQLILTHFSTGETSKLEWHKSRAAEAFAGPIDISQPDRTFDILPTILPAELSTSKE